jgi:signal transduction histidine kinase
MTSIRGRLFVTLLSGLVVVLTAGGAAVYWLAEANLIRQFDAGLEARARVLASLVSAESGSIVLDLADGPTETIRGCFFEYRTLSGEVLRRSDNLAGASLPRHGSFYEAIVFTDIELPHGTDGRAAWLAFEPLVDEEDEEDEEDDGVVALSSGDPPELVVVAALDRGPIDRAMGTLLGALIIVGCVVGLTIGVMVTVGVRWGLAPLDRLRGQIEGVDGRSISRRFEDDGAPCELTPIYRELNRMLDRVEGALERERSFADAAAHELRTPLAELRTTAEVAVRWPDTDRASATLRELLSIGREMEHLVESLLLISRGNANALNGATDEISVASIVHGCLQRTAGSIRQKRLKLTVDLDSNGSLPAPQDAVEIIIRNLIDNAVQYTPSDGTITISGNGAADGSPALTVANAPVCLDEYDVPRLFEPFWRMQGSRSDREHAGLGLAVVDQVARAIGLNVDAELEGDRLQIRVSMAAPRRAPEAP